MAEGQQNKGGNYFEEEWKESEERDSEREGDDVSLNENLDKPEVH